MNIAIANQFTKEAIKSRMLQHAANLWGIKNPNALDPFVRLLIEAFSTEIYRASNETQNIEGRILDKIARMLTPNLLTMPKPAHGIIQAKPLDSAGKMHGNTKFTTVKKMAASGGSAKDEEIQITFCPVNTSHLVNGRVAFVATAYQLFSIDSLGFRQSALRTQEPFPPATCLVGIKLSKKVSNLKDVSLYFDFPSYGSDAWIYQLLPLVKISCNGADVATQAGFFTFPEETPSLGREIFSDYNLMEKIHEEIRQQYSHKFLTIGDCPVDHKAANYPHLLLKHFSEVQLQGKVPKDVIWLELKFPPNYNYEILSNCFLAINAFPALNKNLITNTYSYKGLNNILPLRTEPHERFMTVKRATDASGREYFELPYNTSTGGHVGFYSVRHGGVERFDQRSAQDMVSYLLELTRDEVAAFSSLDQTFIRTSLEGLVKQLKQIQNKSGQIDKFIKQSPSYLVIEPVDAEENIQVEYWVTQSVEANSLRPGTEFRCLNNHDISPQGAVLLSETFGGREQLQMGERVDACRYALGSRNRLITREDIRNFCKAELGKKLKAIGFKQGIETSPHPKQGYIRTLEILLTPNNYNELQPAEWQVMAENLLTKIRSLSPDGIHYRAKITSEE